LEASGDGEEFVRCNLNHYLGTMVCACHFKLCRRVRLGRWWFQVSSAKKKFLKSISAEKAGHGGVHMLIPAVGESVNRRIKFQTCREKTKKLPQK
jgi:hypothetical protein